MTGQCCCSPRACALSVTLIAIMLTTLTLSDAAIAQTPKLLLPMSSAEVNGMTAAQQQAVAVLRSRPTTRLVTFVRVNIDALSGNAVDVNIPGLPAFTLLTASQRMLGPKRFIWVGTVQEPFTQAILAVNGNAVTGTVEGRGALYQIAPIGNGMEALIQIDQSAYPPDEDANFDATTPVGSPPPTSAAPATKPVGIDIFVAYTGDVAAQVPNIEDQIQLAITDANQSFKNSGIFVELRSVRIEVLRSYDNEEYMENGASTQQMLSDFSFWTQADVGPSGADLEVLFFLSSSDSCGLASAILTKSIGSAVVNQQCAIGNHSFAHEIGHLLGARHNIENDPSKTPFAYGHGLQHPSRPSFRTVMAYSCTGSVACDPRVAWWSSPTVTYNGVATGNAGQADNVRVLNQTAPAIAAINTRVLPSDDIGIRVGKIVTPVKNGFHEEL